ncbi:hypothetical protein [Marinilactibacillus kalidii]|uniref:hypothetical protein n=1 Tax=Marinilactibacillus kalidii TaxID=2820274 RepID=UPI001ABE9810|nr:hypothetical protein [Marinilactibacillus kalidii]
MQMIRIITLLTNLFYALLIVSGYIIKRSLIKILEKSDALKSEQILHLRIIVNTVYYTFALIVLAMGLYPYLVAFFR